MIIVDTILVFDLLYVSYCDIKDRRIPNHSIMLLGIGSMIRAFLKGASCIDFLFPLIWSSVLTFSKIIGNRLVRAMGGGDVKLLCAGSILLGPDIIAATSLGLSIASVWYGILLIARKVRIKDRVPIGQFLSLGLMIYMFGEYYIQYW